MTDSRLVYSRGYPFGAPALYLRGAATRRPDVKAAIKEAGFRWDGGSYAWRAYAYTKEATEIIADLRDRFALTVVAKSDLSADLILALPEKAEA